MKQYWVSFLLQDGNDADVRLCAIYDGCFSLEEAKDIIQKQRQVHRILSAWVDVYVDDSKSTVFHECYVGGIGYEKKKS